MKNVTNQNEPKTNESNETTDSVIKTDENQVSESSAKSESKSAKAEVVLPRVSKKIDMNNVEVEFGKESSAGKFLVADSGIVYGEAEFDGKSEKQIVPLARYLPKGVAHNFSIIFVQP